MPQPKPILIAGPTASGKSALALAVAEHFGGVIINADALQVYDCWRVLTARPGRADCQRAPHRLYGHVGARQPYSVGHWLRDVANVICEARTMATRPVIVGGTGLYLTALTQGLADIPPIPSIVRAQSDQLLASGRIDVLLERLARDDPETLNAIDVKNPRRVQRAWDVLTATGTGLSHWRTRAAPPLISDAVIFKLEPKTDILNNNINDRFEFMVSTGALQECAAFHAAGHSLDLPASRALGCAELTGYLTGRLTRAEAVAGAATATRQYAKRQRTWFRNQMPDWRAVDPNAPDVLDTVLRQSAQ